MVNQELVCMDCGKSFTSSKLIMKHMAYHKENQKECHVCLKNFQNYLKLKDHKRRSNKEKQLCYLCPFEGTSSNMSRHNKEAHFGAQASRKTIFKDLIDIGDLDFFYNKIKLMSLQKI